MTVLAATAERLDRMVAGNPNMFFIMTVELMKAQRDGRKFDPVAFIQTFRLTGKHRNQIAYFKAIMDKGATSDEAFAEIVENDATFSDHYVRNDGTVFK